MHTMERLVRSFLRTPFAANYLPGYRVPASLLGALLLFVIAAMPPCHLLENARATEPAGFDIAEIHRRQEAILDQTARHLAPQKPGVTDLYFVAFGGYAHQDVFLREVLATTLLFEERFGADGRSVRLVNHQATTRHFPMATSDNLGRVLHDIGQRIDTHEDMLFLFLTSHGRPNWLSVDFRPLRLEDLSARQLRAMLDWSGIKWRVIVVSACYSGSFIDALADENTLVMTAARHDRTSFGCTHENDFTYFGRAYFDEALRKTYSFTDAFDAARKTIARREREEGLTPSLPQISMGRAIAPKLDALSRRLRSEGRAQIARQIIDHSGADASAE